VRSPPRSPPVVSEWAEVSSDSEALLRLHLRGSLAPDTPVTADEAVALLPGESVHTSALVAAHAPVVGRLGGLQLHRWGDVLRLVAPGTPTEAETALQPSGSDLLDAAGLAAALDVSQAVVHRWTSERRIPHYKLGHKTVRYRLDEVLASKAQSTAAGKRQTHGREKARKRVDGGLPVRRAGVPRADSIPAFDWTRTDEKGG
jgi:predicted DNA-binding transcriptional regulator AlpA